MFVHWQIFCTFGYCSAGEGFPPGFEYLWVPEGKAGGRKATPQKCSAPQYVDYVMTWVEDQINKEEVTVKFNYLKF
jgi:Mob1/phocein family